MNQSAESSLPFALPDVGEREIEAVAAAIRTGWVTTGPGVHAFEAAFTDALGGGLNAVAVNSATAGLHLALEAIGIGPGSKVLVPAWTFTATAEVVRYLGAEVVLVDVEASTLNIDLAHASSLVDEHTRAIMPVHFAGLPVNYRELEAWQISHPGVAVVEDAAHAFPAASCGVMVGAGTSSASVFSFYATKTITTGEGGMLVTRDSAIAERAKVMRLHGIDRDAFNRYRSSSPAWRYDVVAPGFKYNMTDTAAAMGLVQLERAREMQMRREEIAHRYLDAFNDLPLQLPLTDSRQGTSTHAWHLFVVRVPQGGDRDALIERLAARGIGTSVHFVPLHLLSYWGEDGSSGRPWRLPVASAEFERVVSLPIYSAMSDHDIDRVIQSVKAVLE